MNKNTISNTNIKEGLVPDDSFLWQETLNTSNIEDLFEGIAQAEKDIKNGEKEKDFDDFFEKFNKDQLNGLLFQTNNS